MRCAQLLEGFNQIRVCFLFRQSTDRKNDSVVVCNSEPLSQGAHVSQQQAVAQDEWSCAVPGFSPPAHALLSLTPSRKQHKR